MSESCQIIHRSPEFVFFFFIYVSYNNTHKTKLSSKNKIRRKQFLYLDFDGYTRLINSYLTEFKIFSVFYLLKI